MPDHVRVPQGPAADLGGSPEDSELILFVCTGNVCRSPYLELVARREIAETAAPRVRTASAGIAALVDHPMAARLQKASKSPEASTFRARQLEPAMLRSAALVVTADRDHRRHVSRLEPAVAHRTFTLLQIARLLESDDPRPLGSVDAPVAALLQHLDDRRGRGRRASEADDVVDPWQRSRWTYRRSARQMDAGLRPLVDALRG